MIMKTKKVLVTGGAGYIGSHACKALAREGFEPIVVDNLSTGHREAVRWGELHVLDILDTEALSKLVKHICPQAVFHFAGSAYVGESMQQPLEYYTNNLCGTLSLLRACSQAEMPYFVFSSSCTTYGIPKKTPLDEHQPTQPISPYGETKLACERLLHWAGEAYGLKWIALRYFNAAGADLEQEIGELRDYEPHLIPLALKAVAGTAPELSVFGSDYPTQDGTAVRDYIHVSDLADAHIAALKYLSEDGKSQPLNLGTGRGHSVKEVLDTIAAITGSPVPHRFSPRRDGDPAELWANAEKARTLLGWSPKQSTLNNIIASAWEWEKRVTEGKPWSKDKSLHDGDGPNG